MNHADLSATVMRRQVALDAAPTSEHDRLQVNLASRLVASGFPPPAVPVDDPGPHSTVRVGAHQRVQVRPLGIGPQSMTYVGRNIYVVRL